MINQQSPMEEADVATPMEAPGKQQHVYAEGGKRRRCKMI